MKTIIEYLINNHVVKPTPTLFNETYDTYDNFNDVEKYLHQGLPVDEEKKALIKFSNGANDAWYRYISYKELKNIDIHKLIAYCKHHYDRSCIQWGTKPNTNLSIYYYSVNNEEWVESYYIDMKNNPESLQHNSGYSNEKWAKNLQNIFSRYVDNETNK